MKTPGTNVLTRLPLPPAFDLKVSTISRGVGHTGGQATGPGAVQHDVLLALGHVSCANVCFSAYKTMQYIIPWKYPLWAEQNGRLFADIHMHFLKGSFFNLYQFIQKKYWVTSNAAYIVISVSIKEILSHVQCSVHHYFGEYQRNIESRPMQRRWLFQWVSKKYWVTSNAAYIIISVSIKEILSHVQCSIHHYFGESSRVTRSGNGKQQCMTGLISQLRIVWVKMKKNAGNACWITVCKVHMKQVCLVACFPRVPAQSSW